MAKVSALKTDIIYEGSYPFQSDRERVFHPRQRFRTPKCDRDRASKAIRTASIESWETHGESVALISPIHGPEGVAPPISRSVNAIIPIIGRLTGIQGQKRFRDRCEEQGAAGLGNILVSPLRGGFASDRAADSPPRFLNSEFLQRRTKTLHEETGRQWSTESDPRRCIVNRLAPAPGTNFTPKRANKG